MPFYRFSKEFYVVFYLFLLVFYMGGPPLPPFPRDFHWFLYIFLERGWRGVGMDMKGLDTYTSPITYH